MSFSETAAVSLPPRRHRGRPDEVWFDSTMVQKEMNLALELGRQLEVPLPTTAVRRLP